MATNYTRAAINGTNAVTSYNNLYSVPNNRSGLISTIAIANSASASRTYRIGFSSASATDPTAPDFLVYDSIVAANDSVFLSLGVSLPAGTFIKVSSSSSAVYFNAFVLELY